MHLIRNRFISLFVAFSVAFASLWAMSPDAVADAIKEDTTSYFHEHDQQKEIQVTHQDQHEHTQQAPQCNHGCHIAFHLLGFAETNSSNVFGFNESTVVFSYADHLFESPLLQGLYRPPLTLSLV